MYDRLKPLQYVMRITSRVGKQTNKWAHRQTQMKVYDVQVCFGI